MWLGDRIQLCLVFLLALCGVYGSHFRGAIITWKPGTTSNVIEIDYRISWRKSYDYAGGDYACDESTIQTGKRIGGTGEIECFTGCYGSIGSLYYKCTDFSNDEDWSSGKGNMIYQLPASQTQILYFGFQGQAWIESLNVGGAGDWMLKVFANLTVRSDTGRINTSPTAEITPIIRLQSDCNHTIDLPVNDVDNDIVKCRWAKTTPDECGTVCNAFPFSVLDEDKCRLSYSAVHGIGWFVVALQVEDFSDTDSLMPMSSIPVQFLVQVFASGDACVQLSEFVYPTPLDDACIGVPDNTTFESAIVTRVADEDIGLTEIKTISPLGMHKGGLHNISNIDWRMNFTWSPELAGSTVSNMYCFSAVETSGRESEKRCITLLAGVAAPSFINSTQSPSGKWVPTQRLWNISVNTADFTQTDRETYIRLYNDNDVLVEKVDASDRSSVAVDKTNRVLTFETTSSLLEKHFYYFLFDYGVIRGTSFCKAESEAITDPLFWRFYVPKTICSSVPDFQEFPNLLTVYESFPNGSMLFNFTVTGTPDITNVTTDSNDTEQLVKLESIVPGKNVLVRVITITTFDRDGHGNMGHPGSGSVKLSFRAEDACGNIVRKELTVYITERNDNAPILKNIPYTWEIPERPCNMSASFNDISAMDKDSSVNGQVTYAMRPREPHMDGYFQIDSATGTVQQTKCLDFETERNYNFVVTAKDEGPNGRLNSSAELHVRVIDVPDIPPYFLIAPRRIDVHENEAPGYNITRLYALDGDVDISQNTTIRYSITYSQCGEGLFTIDSVDGTVTSVTSLDAEANIIKQHFGVCRLTIKASEMTSSNFTVYGPTSVSTDLYVFVSDDDDNPPMFTSNLYNGTIPRYASPNSSVTLQERIHIFDNDQDFNFTNMKLTLLWANGSDCDAFLAMPTFIHWSGEVQILVKDPSLIQDSINRTFHLNVIATAAMRQSEASLIITILDHATNSMSLCPTSSPVRCPTVTAAPKSSSLDANVACSTVSEHDLRFVRERLLMMRREIDMFVQLLEN